MLKISKFYGHFKYARAYLRIGRYAPDKCTAIQYKFLRHREFGYNRAVYKPRLTLAATYISHERNYLYEYKLPGKDNPQLEKAVNVDFVPFIRGVRVLCTPRLIFSRINDPNMSDEIDNDDKKTRQ